MDQKTHDLAQAAYELWQQRSKAALEARDRIINKPDPTDYDAFKRVEKEKSQAWDEYRRAMREASKALNQRYAELGIPKYAYMKEDGW